MNKNGGVTGMANNMIFWVTPTIIKLKKNSIQKNQDEISSTSIWQCWKADYMYIINNLNAIVSEYINNEMSHFEDFYSNVKN